MSEDARPLRIMPAYPGGNHAPRLAEASVYAVVTGYIGLHSIADVCAAAGLSRDSYRAARAKGRAAMTKLAMADEDADPMFVLSDIERWYLLLEQQLAKAESRVVIGLERSIAKAAMGTQVEVVVERDPKTQAVTRTRTEHIAPDWRAGVSLLKVLRRGRWGDNVEAEGTPQTVVEVSFDGADEETLRQIAGLEIE